jgi:hypothetical protein
MWAFYTPHHSIEAQRDDHPDKAAPRRRGHAQFTSTQTKREKIDADRDEHTHVKGDPEPDARRHAGESFMR